MHPDEILATLMRAQQLISHLRIANLHDADEIYLMQMEADYLLPQIHEARLQIQEVLNEVS